MATAIKFVDGFSSAIRMHVADEALTAPETGKPHMMAHHVLPPSRGNLCRFEVGVGDVAWKGPERSMEMGDTAVDVGDVAVEIEARG
jgi:hypothetical protein